VRVRRCNPRGKREGKTYSNIPTDDAETPESVLTSNMPLNRAQYIPPFFPLFSLE
jgi:hypothetical protein